MSIVSRQWAYFAAGLLLGAVASASIVLLLHPASRQDTARAANPTSQAEAPQSPESPLSQRAVCPSEASLPPAGDTDGQFEVKNDLSGNSARDVTVLITLGKEAAGAGRIHDAEVAFVMSCRVAEKFAGPGSLEYADAKYQLARHYTSVANNAAAATGANRGEMLQLAERLYSDSLQRYRSSYGDGDERSRLAIQGLASARQMLAQVQPQAQAQSGAPAQPKAEPQQQPERQPHTQALAQAQQQSQAAAESQLQQQEPAVSNPEPSPPAPPSAEASSGQTQAARVRPNPSFECRKARSVNEKLICSDAQLAQLDRELGRLNVKARSLSSNRAAFKRRSDAAWHQRETSCRDRECLVKWYAQRRAQLNHEIAQARPRQRTASR